MIVYDNITDPLELYKISIRILNLIAENPILDEDSVSFYDCYELNTNAM